MTMFCCGDTAYNLYNQKVCSFVSGCPDIFVQSSAAQSNVSRIFFFFFFFGGVGFDGN